MTPTPLCIQQAGIASGLKSLGKGILGGSVGLIAAPFMGAATGGVAGFAKGVATGTGPSATAAAAVTPHAPVAQRARWVQLTHLFHQDLRALRRCHCSSRCVKQQQL
jgi:hypothetical protein